MAGTTSHNYILYKALRNFSGSSAALRTIKSSLENARAFGRDDWNDPGAFKEKELAGAAFLGCCGPDLFYLDLGSTGCFIADLLHYNRTGLFMIWWLRQLKKTRNKLADPDTGRFLQMQYAYCLGHISHIAADITIHPYVNSIVQAYPLNEKNFENARGMTTANLWKFHNVLEQYQDAYVLHEKFYAEEGFTRGKWEGVNIARWGAQFFLQPANSGKLTLVSKTREFYRYAKNYDQGLEDDKFRFFASQNYLLNLDAYYTVTIPDRTTMLAANNLVQPRLFDQYIDRAVSLAQQMFAEAEGYLLDSTKEDFADPTLAHAKTFFPLLRRHWNLDCGLAPAGAATPQSTPVPNRSDTQLCLAGGLDFTPANDTDSLPDLSFPYKAA